MLVVDVTFASPSAHIDDDVRKFVYNSAYSSAPLHSPSPIHRHAGGSAAAPPAVTNSSFASSESFVLDRTSSMVLRSKAALSGVDSATSVIHVPPSGLAPVPPLSTYMLQCTRSLDSGCSSPSSDVQEGAVLIEECANVNDHSGRRTPTDCKHPDERRSVFTRKHHDVDITVEDHHENSRRPQCESSKAARNNGGRNNDEISISQFRNGAAFIANSPPAAVISSMRSNSPPVWSLAQQESNNGSPIPTVLIASHVNQHNSIVQMSLLEDDVTPPLYFRDEDDA
jgi:hypothetical protein